MCLGGGGSAKVKVPKPAPLPPPIPAPPPPKPPAPAPKPIQKAGATPDIRIGSAKRQSTSSSRRSPAAQSPGKQALSIGNSQGLNI